ncbi:phosphotransferase family enzyme [Novosphingobium kunmingense]|uniref:Phosphotransferase family enzyme n=1 Tax=Novosphingobium kunmingense TaxID=1211806 RepID=A0A2N0I283_9SPHN|nr:phosphotransferase [Novosphingobium kunmingense]PKB25260.1 phosphotransferase family enzyme [Novosphingobium kunmingense]
MADFPTQPEAVTAEWLEAGLRTSGAIGPARIRSVDWEAIGTGQVGDSARFTLAYDQEAAGPATVAGKFPAADQVSRGTAAAFGLYAKEVGFYRELRQQVGVRVAVPHIAQIAEDGVDFVLIFEDLGPARGGNQLASCSLEDARAAVVQAASLHAPSWGNAAILGTPWLQSAPGQAEQVRALYPNAQAIWRERYADQLEPEYMAICEELNDLAGSYFIRTAEPKCLIHGDFRLDNMLFDIKGGAEPIAILDWQTVALGNGLTDIGYFLGCGIGAELRRAHEAELLDLYCGEMTARGVAMTRDGVWDDYRLGALHGISTAVFSAAYVERTPRGDENFLSMARGACDLALEHDSLGALRKAC